MTRAKFHLYIKASVINTGKLIDMVHFQLETLSLIKVHITAIAIGVT